MSTCRGCWGDDLRGPETVLVTTGEDPLVSHVARPDCPIADEPHRMADCGAFGAPARPVTPSDELAPCPPIPAAWEAHTRAVRAGYYAASAPASALTPA